MIRSDHYNQGPMGYRHTKDEILAGALGVAFDDGLSQLTFGRVAKRLAISDRVVVYYFPTKDDLIGEVLVSIGLQLQHALEPVMASSAEDYLHLLRAVWPTVAQPEADAVFALFFEANGLAASGREPYRTIVPMLVEIWVAWAAQYFSGTKAERRIEAEAAIALLDGLLLLRQLGGPDAGERAARRLGISEATRRRT